MGTIILLFLTTFGLIALIASLGFKYQESQQKKKVTRMLETTHTGTVVETKVLLDANDKTESGFALLVQSFNFAKTLETRLQQSGLSWSLNTLALAMAGLAVGGALLGFKFRPLVSPVASAIGIAIIAGAVPYFYVGRARNKRMDAFEEQFPDALEFLARAMRAGHAFSVSLEMLAEESPVPLKVEFRKVFNEQNLGLPIETALQNLATRMPLLDVRFFVSAVLLQRETGGNLSEILTRLAYIIRERFKLKGQVRSASAHGRITGGILTVLPVALYLGFLVISPAYIQSMTEDPDGQIMIGGAVAGVIIGHFCIQKIIKIKV